MTEEHQAVKASFSWELFVVPIFCSLTCFCKSNNEREISNAKEVEESFTVDDNKKKNKGIQLDDYINESMAILVDYINLIKKEKK